MSQALRKLTGTINKTGTAVIFINQIRLKIGVMFGNPETTTGGNALKFYASQRIDVRRVGAIKDNEEVTGNKTRIKVVKNKLAPPFKEAEFDIMYNEGICKWGDIIDLAVKKEIIQKSGSWFSYDGERLGQGRDAVKTLLKENDALFKNIEQKVKDVYGFPQNTSAVSASENTSSDIEDDEIDVPKSKRPKAQVTQ